MDRVTITCSNGPVELSEFVEDLYSVSEKANRALKELRIGLPTWTAKETYNMIIPGLFEPPVRTLRFFRNYPFLI